ncbi:DUF4347 domain-containing protein [Sorangium sp. So ce1036]|uniref:DUF4347 domain-containing protein n=1 Tax=Sorangium sp. So ce1036 TaxID=3133328 RepID=UPI003F0FB04E
MGTSLRLVLFDNTDLGRGAARWVNDARRRLVGLRRAAAPAAPDATAPDAPPPDGTADISIGLTRIWRAGAVLHRMTGAADAWLGAASWAESLAWAARTARARRQKIASLQAWGHGGWGYMALGGTRLDEAALRPGSPLDDALTAFREELTGPEAVVWLRCCSAFGHTGRTFARALADRLGCRVASHTYIIGFYQSGTHSLRPSEEPTWDPREGVRLSGGRPVGARASGASEPNTVTCLTLNLPPGY